MDFRQAIQKTRESDVYKSWKDTNYLVSCLLMENKWHVSFCSKKNNKITSFLVNTEVIKEAQDEKAFQEKKDPLEELKLEEIKLEQNDVEELMKKAKEKYAPQEGITQKIFILQHKEVPLWNLTYVTSAFNLLNVKINAASGEILEEKFSPLFALRKN